MPGLVLLLSCVPALLPFDAPIEEAEVSDLDSDGVTEAEGDCDDDDASISPEADETCGDGVDNDCEPGAAGCGLLALTSFGDAPVRIVGTDPGEAFGSALSAGLDLDGDDAAELLVGAPLCDRIAVDGGCAYLFLGPIGGNLDTQDAGASIRGPEAGGATGAAVTFLDDLDRDGQPEFGIGSARLDVDGLADTGAFDVFENIFGVIELYGVTSGSLPYQGWGSALASVGDVDGDGRGDLAIGSPGWPSSEPVGAATLAYGPMTRATHLVGMTGESEGDAAGTTLANAGDVDGDGTNDLLVGAPGSDAPAEGAGAVYLVLLPIEDAIWLEDVGDRITGQDTSDAAGSALAGAGDLDDDGYADIALGVPGRDGTAESAGAVCVFRGPQPGLVGIQYAWATALGEWAEDAAGSAVVGPGDLDGDGRADLVIGAPGQDAAGTDAGAVYLWSGPAEGTLLLADAAARVLGEAAGDLAGSTLAPVDDADADGIPDVAAGAPGWGAGTGAVYLLFGGGP